MDQLHRARRKFKNVLRLVTFRQRMADEGYGLEAGMEAGMKEQNGSTGSDLDQTGNRQSQEPHPTLSMKLFDRVVDVGQFKKSTPLYPVCRAWIHNNKHPPCHTDAIDPDEDEKISEGEDLSEMNLDSVDVRKLPPPVLLPYDNFGNQINIRIPAPLKREYEPFFIDDDNRDIPSPLPAILYSNHVIHWKKVRETWAKASENNERRYEASNNILDNIFVRVDAGWIK